MSKLKVSFECSECGEKHSKWQGKCNGCGAWNSLIETASEPQLKSANKRFAALNQASMVVNLEQISAQDVERKATHIEELDRVLGGGLARGSVILLGGDPGIGKSTLLLQTLAHIAQTNRVLYITGEESVQQVALRAKRLEVTRPTGMNSGGMTHAIMNCSNLRVMSEIRLEAILPQIENEKPDVVVVDSIQTVYSEMFQSAPGSVAQVRECASILTRLAKNRQLVMILVGHVTKEGAIAGPRVLEHIVDTVLYFEGEQHSNFRMLRSVKNRFGAVNELGIFAMTDKGLKEVSNPSALFLSSYRQDIPGSCILISEEGTRPLLVEVQALVDQSHLLPAKRLAVGMDNYRLAMLIAIMQRHLGIQLYDQDIFLNIVGGLKISEPALDLAVVLAIISSLKNKPLPEKMAVCGEIGLSGEIRTVQKGQDRIKEAAKLGFKRILIPTANLPKQPLADIELVAVANLTQVANYCFG